VNGEQTATAEEYSKEAATGIGTQQTPSVVFESAFQLNLEKGRLDNAMKLVACGFKPDLKSVLHLAHAIIRVHQQVWYGLDFTVQEKWRKALRAAWHMNRNELLTNDQTLLLHEVLSGRLSSMMVNTSVAAGPPTMPARST
jgi:hypothetical protein